MASALLEVLRGGPSEDELRFRRHVKAEAIRQEDAAAWPLAGATVEEDLQAIRARILTGLPPLPCPGWRW